MDIPDCMKVEEIKIAMLDDEHIGMLLRTHVVWLAINQSLDTEWPAAILVIQR